MQKFELVFIPSPRLSHLVSTVEMAKLLLDRDRRLSVTVLIMKFPNDTTLDTYTRTTSENHNKSSRLRFINVPTLNDVALTKTFRYEFVDRQTSPVREAIADLIKQSSQHASRLIGLVLDVFCTKFIDVAEEFAIPAYIFFTSGAYGLGLLQHLVALKYEQEQDMARYNNSDVELSVPCFSVPVPARVLPSFALEEPIASVFMQYFRRMSRAKGIMVNTFYEFESNAIDSFLSEGYYKMPKVYPVGPILSPIEGVGNEISHDNDDVKKWLDDQPENSVVFLCFGTMGSLVEAQVKEIGAALENSGKRFLWSLRKRKGNDKVQFATEYEDFEEVLPEGFLQRTKGVGKVIGWAAQMAVLSHAAVGGFVSHCGWNSILESVWLGVPIATFPMYAEQQMNAFQLVKEQGMAEMIRLDYKIDLLGEKMPEIVGAEEIEAALRRLMGGGGVREKVKDMQKKGRLAFMEGGSSYKCQSLFIEDVITNMDSNSQVYCPNLPYKDTGSL